MAEIILQFYRSSKNAKKLQKIAEQFTSFNLPQDLSEPCEIYINKDCYPEDLRLFTYFWGIIKKHKDSAVFVNDKMLTTNQIRAITGWFDCYCNQEYFDNKTEYCFVQPGIKYLHGWGCKHLHSVLRHGRFGRHNGIPWYKIGPFDGEVQYIDKLGIKEKLQAEAESKCLELCPLFSLEKAFKYIDMLPDQINPTIDTEWEYNTSEEPESNDKILGVKPKTI